MTPALDDAAARPRNPGAGAMPPFLDVLQHDRMLPLMTPAVLGDADPVMERLTATGTGTLEIALRSEVAEHELARVAGRARLLVGAGTVLTVDQVNRVVDAGAHFVVTPGFSAPVVERCLERGIPVLPGVATPGEVMAALDLGLTAVKLFPAAQLGGPAMVRSLAGPFPAMRVVPSGGVTPESVAGYLALPTVLAVSGSWMAEA